MIDAIPQVMCCIMKEGWCVCVYSGKGGVCVLMGRCVCTVLQTGISWSRNSTTSLAVRDCHSVEQIDQVDPLLSIATQNATPD